jgi:hypothetical protein
LDVDLHVQMLVGFSNTPRDAGTVGRDAGRGGLGAPLGRSGTYAYAKSGRIVPAPSFRTTRSQKLIIHASTKTISTVTFNF